MKSYGFLISRIGLMVIAAALLLCVGLISFLPSFRIDLTEDKLYSLSDGTKAIVSSLPEPLELLFFYSESATKDNPPIRSYGFRVQELLREIVIESDGQLTFKLIDPEPFSEEEDLAKQFGIQPVPLSQGGEGIYFGLVAVQAQSDLELNLRQSETLPLIRPDQEEFLEYETMKLVSRVSRPELPTIGILTELTIDGGFDPVSGRPSEPWMIMDIIRQLYSVRRLDIAASVIEEDIDILMIIHPEDLSEQTLYAIDQFVLTGGKSMIFLDPNADSMVARSAQGIMVPAGLSSSLPGLLESWGVQFDSQKVLADSDLALRVMLGQGSRPVAHLGMLGAKRSALSQDDIITSDLETLNLSSAGVISAIEGSPTKFEPLVQSSAQAMLMDVSYFSEVSDPSTLFDQFEPTGEVYTIAARVSGPLKTSFKDGRPPQLASEDSNIETEEQDSLALASINPADPEEETADGETHLESSKSEANLLIVADSDFLSDRLWVQISQFLGQRIPQPFANNADFVINALDNLAGDSSLVSIRSRGRYSRPFDRVLKMQRDADDRLRAQESELLEGLAETEEQIAQLSVSPNGEPLGMITPEIQAEVDRFNDEMLETRRNLRSVQFKLTEEIDKLGNNLKWANAFGIPFILSVGIFSFVTLRNRRRRA
ncbi:Gldg family protein [bacterium]|nr:Gldg family protein [bacterium]MDA9901054.1 Gldg family protein [Gammaproteobacteria bacterium]